MGQVRLPLLHFRRLRQLPCVASRISKAFRTASWRLPPPPGRNLRVSSGWPDVENGTNGSTVTESYFDPSLSYGPCAFDVPQDVAPSADYELPFGHGKRYLTHGPLVRVLGNWESNLFFIGRSGQTFQVTNGGGDPAGLSGSGGIGRTSVSGDGRPDVVPGRALIRRIKLNLSGSTRQPSASFPLRPARPVQRAHWLSFAQPPFPMGFPFLATSVWVSCATSFSMTSISLWRRASNLRRQEPADSR